jgi:hypothetical protein
MGIVMRVAVSPLGMTMRMSPMRMSPMRVAPMRVAMMSSRVVQRHAHSEEHSEK